MFNPKNDKDVEKAREYVTEWEGAYWNSSMYAEYWDRFEKRLLAYRCKHTANAPKWRSKLHFATFFMACKALDAQFRRSHRTDPFIWLTLEDGNPQTKEMIEMAKIAQFDLNHDLYVSNYVQTLTEMYWYVELIGTCVGRDYVYSDQVESTSRKIVQDQYGFENEQSDKVLQRKEHTKTELVHPLNFAHDATKPDFKRSRQTCIRIEVPHSEIYKMKGNDSYYQKGVNELIELIEKDDKNSNWSVGKDTFYAENYDKKSSVTNSLILYEYSGDFNYGGNKADPNKYYMLYSKSLSKVLRVGKGPFSRHHFWKLSVNQDPYGPYAVGPSDMVLPLTYWKNSTVNQYNDYANSVLKYLWQVDPGQIVGGLPTLLSGLPNGLIVTEPDALGKGIQPLARDRNSLPPVGDIMNMIDKAIQDQGPSSNLRGRSSNQLSDTATGISLMAEREDTAIEALQDDLDFGIVDCMQMKLQNRGEFMTQPITGEIEKNAPPVKYFPWELSEGNFSFKVRRETSDIQSGKYMSFLKLISQFTESGAVPIGSLIKLAKRVGYAMNIDEIDELLPDPTPVNANVPGAEGDVQPGAEGLPSSAAVTEASSEIPMG